MFYRKLKRVYSHGYANYIPKFDKVFPELKNLNSEELCDRFRELKLEFFQEEIKPVPIAIRFTLPFAIFIMILMFIGLPIVFLITGKWTYSFSEKNHLLNWFKALRLL